MQGTRRTILALGGFIALAGCASSDPNAPLDFETARELSIVIEACAPLGAIPDRSHLFFSYDPVHDEPPTWTAGPGSPLAEREAAHCALAAGADCAAVRACFHVTATQGLCATYTSVCDGDSAILRCTPPRAMASSPCPVGTHCITRGPTTAECGIDTCVADGSADACTSDHGGQYCDSTLVVEPYECRPGQDCAPGIGCNPTGSTCTAGSCEGDVAVSCEPDLTQPPDASAIGARTDCGAIGMHCVVVGGRAECVPAATECTHDERVCTGNVLRLCAPEGRYWEYDCVAHGFARCEPGTNDTSAAFCVPAVGPIFHD